MCSIFKGWLGEKATQFGMWIKLDSNTYHRFHNLILNTQNGTTQIDHILLSRLEYLSLKQKITMDGYSAMKIKSLGLKF
jgi:restriction system protein